ncbi:hypothetical protein PoB_000421100 [Plakobranchus ocellatus]|uniref:Uncharacterized protein n=1 Tax=Plakobranchus ocellatus TaxID=259542 RepID=A0AAV3XPC6_9GAST|nr:hypothetical protein PoB_000421100 [Plakobranchus ocellatus]
MESPVVLFTLLLVIIVFLRHYAQCACTFPTDLTSTWRSSRWDDMTFTSSQVTVASMTNVGTNVVFDCESASGSKYLIRLLMVSEVDKRSIAMICTRSMVWSGRLKCLATAETFLLTDNQPVRLVTPGSAISEANTCTVSSPYSTGSNDLLIKTDQTSAAAITCPDPLLANFAPYTVTKSSGATSCGTSGSINICSHTTNVVVDYTSCSEVIYYSSKYMLEVAIPPGYRLVLALGKREKGGC